MSRDRASEPTGRSVDGESLADLAGLLADPTRARMCLALLDGRAWTAGELSRLTGVAASTASEHLSRLVDGGLLVEERQGRHRYVRLAGPTTAQLVEDLAAHASAGAPRPQSLRAVRTAQALSAGRTCYDHLAGRLGVRLLDAMAGLGLAEVTRGVSVTEAGTAWMAGLGIDVGAMHAGRRPLARACLDWTERRPHLGGAAGAGLCEHCLASGWVERTGPERAVRVTAAGERALEEQLGLDPRTCRAG